MVIQSSESEGRFFPSNFKLDRKLSLLIEDIIIEGALLEKRTFKEHAREIVEKLHGHLNPCEIEKQ
jgi:hypothetical protein